MSFDVNKLYGLLTDGDKTIRNTTVNRSAAPKSATKLLEALMPDVLDSGTSRALAEFYIRLCATDKGLQKALMRYDPLNSYALHTFYENYADSFDIFEIVKGIKKLGLSDEEASFLPLDYIVNALRQLLGVLNG